jgi:superfamily II DNA/RNA helicase
MSSSAIKQMVQFIEQEAMEKCEEIAMKANEEFEQEKNRIKMEEKNRDKVLLDFHAGTSRILITTNVLSRGIDVPAVSAARNT